MKTLKTTTSSAGSSLGLATPRRLCVYCGARNGNSPDYAKDAYALGRNIALRGIELVYGGGANGLMGQVAQGALDAGGHVIGIIPEALMNRELGRRDLQTLHIVPDMHVRKMQMADLADGFIALPGGLGTMDELFEIMAWAQLGFHQKPIGLLNTAGYYNHWLAWLSQMKETGFFDPSVNTTPIVADLPDDLVRQVLLPIGA
jgi:uncharacterized protein (TIGR00730 family)